MEELNIIQTGLVADKDKKNQFAGFEYRNLESILTSVKPLLAKTKCTITFSDEIHVIQERLFIVSTATLKNSKGEMEQSVAFAELDSHKGMSKEQNCGSASSYARKYAISSLLGISDGYDPDALDNREAGEEAPKKAVKTPKQAVKLVKGIATADEIVDFYNNVLPNFSDDADVITAYNEKYVELQSKGII